MEVGPFVGIFVGREVGDSVGTPVGLDVLGGGAAHAPNDFVSVLRKDPPDAAALPLTRTSYEPFP